MTAPADQGQSVDGADRQSYDAAEAAIAAAIAAILTAWLLHPRTVGSAGRLRRQVESGVGPSIRSFMQRTAFDMYQHAGKPSTPAADDVDSQYQAVVDRLSDWVTDAYDRLRTSVTIGTEPNNTQVRTAASGLARSITNDAFNGVREEVAHGLGAVWSEWVSRHDSRVRETHGELDGQQIPFGSKFVSPSGALLSRPGDPEAPPSETFGCRCHLRYRLHPHGWTPESES